MTKDKVEALVATKTRMEIATESTLLPLSQAADVIASNSWDRNHVDVSAVERGLQDSAALIGGGSTSPLEEMLLAQAYGLNSSYQRLMLKASSPEVFPHPERLQSCLNIAFRAQRQCLQTIELLARLKNPLPHTVVQQNFLHAAPDVGQAAEKKYSSKRTDMDPHNAALD